MPSILQSEKALPNDAYSVALRFSGLLVLPLLSLPCHGQSPVCLRLCLVCYLLVLLIVFLLLHQIPHFFLLQLPVDPFLRQRIQLYAAVAESFSFQQPLTFCIFFFFSFFSNRNNNLKIAGKTEIIDSKLI